MTFFFHRAADREDDNRVLRRGPVACSARGRWRRKAALPCP
jgi:hypothetical protein